MVYAQPTRLQSTRTYSKVKNNVKRRKRKDRSSRRSTLLDRQNIVFPRRFDESIFKSDDSLRDDYWMDEFDRIAQGKTPLRKKKLLVKAVRTDYNRDSSIDCTPKALTPPIDSVLLTPSRTPIFSATPSLMQKNRYNHRATTPAASRIPEAQSTSATTPRPASDGALLTRKSKVAGPIVKMKFFKDFVPNRSLDTFSEDSNSSLDELALPPYFGDNGVNKSLDTSQVSGGREKGSSMQHTSFVQNDTSVIDEGPCGMVMNEILSPLSCGNMVSKRVEDNSLHENRLQSYILDQTIPEDHFGERSCLPQSRTDDNEFESEFEPRIAAPVKAQNETQRNSVPKRRQVNFKNIETTGAVEQSPESESQRDVIKMASENDVNKRNIPARNYNYPKEKLSNMLKNEKQINKEICVIEKDTVPVSEANVTERINEIQMAGDDSKMPHGKKYQLRRAKKISNVPLSKDSAVVAKSSIKEVVRKAAAVAKADNKSKQTSHIDKENSSTASIRVGESNNKKQNPGKRNINKITEESKTQSSSNLVIEDKNLKFKKPTLGVSRILGTKKTPNENIIEPQHSAHVSQKSREITTVNVDNTPGYGKRITRKSSRKYVQCEFRPEISQTIVSTNETQKKESKDDSKVESNSTDNISKTSMNKSINKIPSKENPENMHSLPRRYSLRSKSIVRPKSFSTTYDTNQRNDSNLCDKYVNDSVDCLPLDQRVTKTRSQVSKNGEQISLNEKQRKDLLRIDEKYVKKKVLKMSDMKKLRAKSMSRLGCVERDRFMGSGVDGFDANIQDSPTVISQACPSSSQINIDLNANPAEKRVNQIDSPDNLTDFCETQMVTEQIKFVKNPNNLRRVKVKIKRLAAERIIDRSREKNSLAPKNSSLAEVTNMMGATKVAENASLVPKAHLNVVSHREDQENSIEYSHETNATEIISEINREPAICCQVGRSPPPVKRRRLEIRLKRMTAKAFNKGRQCETMQRHQHTIEARVSPPTIFSTIPSEMNQSLDSYQEILEDVADRLPCVNAANQERNFRDKNLTEGLSQHVPTFDTAKEGSVERNNESISHFDRSHSPLGLQTANIDRKSEISADETRSKEQNPTERLDSASLVSKGLAETIEKASVPPKSQFIPLELAGKTSQLCTPIDTNILESSMDISYRMESPFNTVTARHESAKSVGRRSDHSKESKLATAENESEISLGELAYNSDTDTDSIDSILDFSDFIVNNLPPQKSCTTPISIQSEYLNDSPLISQENDRLIRKRKSRISGDVTESSVAITTSGVRESTVRSLENIDVDKSAAISHDFIPETLATKHASLKTSACIPSDVHDTYDNVSEDTTHSEEITSSISSRNSAKCAIIDRAVRVRKRVCLDLANTATNSTGSELADLTDLICRRSNPTPNQTLASSLQRSLDDSIDRDSFINAITRNASKFLENKSLARLNQSSVTPSNASDTARRNEHSPKRSSNRKIMIDNTLVPRRSSILRGSARNSLTASLGNTTLHEDDEHETSAIGIMLGDKGIVLQPGKWRKSLNAWRRSHSIVVDKTNTGTANSSSVNNSANQSNQLRQQQQQNSITITPNRQQPENHQNSTTRNTSYMLLSSRCGGTDRSVVKNQDNVLGSSNVVLRKLSVNVIRTSEKLSNATGKPSCVAKRKNSERVSKELPRSILENSLDEGDARSADRPNAEKVLLLEPTDDGIPNLPSISLLESAIEQNLQISVRSSQKSVERALSTSTAATTTVADTILDESSQRGVVYNETDLNEYHRRQIYQHQLSVPLYQRHPQQQLQQQQQPSIPRRRRTSVIDDHSIIPIPTSGGRQLQLQQQKLQRHRNGTGDGSTDDLDFGDFVHIPYESVIKSSLNARDRVLRRCNQSEPLEFSIVYSENVLRHCRKIGEGVYGEVFMNKTVRGEAIVLKIIPIEGSIEVNGEPQKRFDEILSEIVIAMELSRLRDDKKFMTSGFVDVKKVCCVQGRYPEHLIDLWELYRDNCGTENDHPEIFPDDQLYIVLELANGGQDLEAFTFRNALQSYSAFLQTALSLAVAEQKFQFEHRDLHWGNILLAPTDHAETIFRLNGEDIKIPTHGVKVTIIDYTLSRMVYDGCRLYNDLSNDSELFLATGDYQFDIYRFMKQHLKNQWESFEPYTNVLWLHYTIDKMISGARYRCSKSKKHRSAIQDMMRLRDELLDYKSASDYVECLK